MGLILVDVLHAHALQRSKEETWGEKELEKYIKVKYIFVILFIWLLFLCVRVRSQGPAEKSNKE